MKIPGTDSTFEPWPRFPTFMPVYPEFILGEYSRTLDERYRLALPQELADALAHLGTDFVLVKEQAGCLSLWPAAQWQARTAGLTEVLQAKLRAGGLQNRLAEVQSLGRLLSTRHRNVQLESKGRLLIPEGFREFLHVEPGGEVLVVGAAVCVEIWHPQQWRATLAAQLPEFQQKFEALAR